MLPSTPYRVETEGPHKLRHHPANTQSDLVANALAWLIVGQDGLVGLCQTYFKVLVSCINNPIIKELICSPAIYLFPESLTI